MKYSKLISFRFSYFFERKIVRLETFHLKLLSFELSFRSCWVNELKEISHFNTVDLLKMANARWRIRRENSICSPNSQSAKKATSEINLFWWLTLITLIIDTDIFIIYLLSFLQFTKLFAFPFIWFSFSTISLSLLFSHPLRLFFSLFLLKVSLYLSLFTLIL